MSTEDIQDQEHEEPALPTYQQKAMERGWRPQEEFEGDPDDWVDAKEFVFRGELMDTIHQERRARTSVEKKYDELQSTVQDLKGHYEKMAELEIKERLKELKSQKADAMRVDDVDAVIELDEQIDDLNEEYKSAKQATKAAEKAPDTPQNAPIPPEVGKWVQENPWANPEAPEFKPALYQKAVAMLTADVQLNGNEDVQGSLSRVKADMQKLYPDELGTKKRPPSSVDVDNPGKKANSSSGLVRKLSPEQRKVGEKFVRSGAYDKLEDYAKELNKLGEV